MNGTTREVTKVMTAQEFHAELENKGRKCFEVVDKNALTNGYRRGWANFVWQPEEFVMCHMSMEFGVSIVRISKDGKILQNAGDSNMPIGTSADEYFTFGVA